LDAEGREKKTMRVTITTEGGFAGRGIGSAAGEVDSGELHPESWQRHYAAAGADLIHYTLTAGDRSVSWQEGADIPDDLRRAFEQVWSQK
jgi:hypothetical protein